MAQILLIARRALEYRALQAERRWTPPCGRPTIDLIQVEGKSFGLGRAGQSAGRPRAGPGRSACADGVRRTPDGRLPNVEAIYPPERLGEMLARADFVAVLVPLTDRTHRLIGEPELRAMSHRLPDQHQPRAGRRPAGARARAGRGLDRRRLARRLRARAARPGQPALDAPERDRDAPLRRRRAGAGRRLGGRDRGQPAPLVRGRPLRNQINRADVVTTFEPPSH